MATRPKIRARVRAGSAPYTADGASGAKHFVADSFQNFAAQLGIGTNNLSSGATYGFNPISRNRTQLEWMYRGSWLVGRVVDCRAEDMTRAGIDIESDMRPDDLDALEQYMRDLLLWQRIHETIKWARLYGGAIGFIMIDGQDPSKPLRPETIGIGQFKGVMPLDRWMVWPHLEDLVSDPGEDFGSPKYYEIVADARTLPHWKIHHSRVFRMEGVKLPYWQRLAENTWGISVVERFFDRLVAFDSTTQGAAQLVYRAHLRSYYVPGLRELIAAGGPMYQAFLQQVQLIRLMQSNESLSVFDADDKFETYQYSFSGLSDVLVQFQQQIAGAAETPITRLFGQSPAGMNSTGESDMRNYYDSVNADQESDLRLPVSKLLNIAHRSRFGKPLPKGFNYSFSPLWQMSDQEKASYATTVTQAVDSVLQTGIIGPDVALKELRQASRISGVWTNITDEDIEKAVQQANAPGPEELLDQIPGILAGEHPEGEPGAQPDAPSLAENTLMGNEDDLLPDGTLQDNPDLPDNEHGALTQLAHERPDEQSPSQDPLSDEDDDMQGEGDAPHLHGPVELEGVTLNIENHPNVRVNYVKDELPPMMDVHGIPIVVETRRGDTRRGYGWAVQMPAHYGYIQATNSAEGRHEQMDVFVGPDEDSEHVWIIEQGDPDTQVFDEHKCMLGYMSRADAMHDYANAFADGKGEDRIRQIIYMHIDDFRNWLGLHRYGEEPIRRSEVTHDWNERAHPRGQPHNAGQFAPKGKALVAHVKRAGAGAAKRVTGATKQVGSAAKHVGGAAKKAVHAVQQVKHAPKKGAAALAKLKHKAVSHPVVKHPASVHTAHAVQKALGTREQLENLEKLFAEGKSEGRSKLAHALQHAGKTPAKLLHQIVAGEAHEWHNAAKAIKSIVGGHKPNPHELEALGTIAVKLLTLVGSSAMMGTLPEMFGHHALTAISHEFANHTIVENLWKYGVAGMQMARHKRAHKQIHHEHAQHHTQHDADMSDEQLMSTLLEWLSEGVQSADLSEFFEKAKGSLTHDAGWNEQQHPRGQPENAGEFAPKGSGSKASANAPAKTSPTHGMINAPADRATWPDHIKALRVPPAWKNVQINPNPNAALQVTGEDAKGRKQYVYARHFAQSQAAMKFARIKELEQKIDGIRQQNQKNQKSSDPSVREHADAVALIMEMGIRPGSTEDTKAAVKAYGATTLEGRHVVAKGNQVRLKFVGKKGVNIDVPVADKALASMLTNRAATAGPHGQLFPSISARSLLDYVHAFDGGGFKTKDLRTHLAAKHATLLVKGMPTPKNEKEYKKAVRGVATEVSQRLGNTPTVALQSYIPPEVFAPWQSALHQ